MIVVRLIGGLGNQLFQYSTARHLAEIRGSVLKIDISGFETYKLHKYSLWPFNIQENFASSEEVAKLAPKMGIVRRILMRVSCRPQKLAKTHIKEKAPFYFNPEILKLPDEVYLDGYWQNEKYFSDIEDIIRCEIAVKTPQMGKNKELAEQITSCEAVSIHIRRGDYISNNNTNKKHGTCNLDYYFRCLEYITNTINHPHIFVFSDEPKWACDNLKLTHPTTIVDCNGVDKNYEDIRLMSQCKYNIIANSTFSWWAAWLNKCPDKIVIAPKKWFNDYSINTSGLIPDSWIQL
jgi:hypothetical protein